MNHFDGTSFTRSTLVQGYMYVRADVLMSHGSARAWRGTDRVTGLLRVHLRLEPGVGRVGAIRHVYGILLVRKG